MVTNYLRTNIRLDKVHTRNNKPHYSHLSKEKYRFVKIFERVKEFEKSIGQMEIGSDKN